MQEQEMYEKAFFEGKQVILEMSKNYERYLRVLINKGIKDVYLQTVLFGTYILKYKKDNEHHISVKKFDAFLESLKEDEITY
jgi:hypothetical protein